MALQNLQIKRYMYSKVMYNKINILKNIKQTLIILKFLTIFTEKTYQSKSATSSPYNTRRNMTTKQPKKVRNYFLISKQPKKLKVINFISKHSKIVRIY